MDVLRRRIVSLLPLLASAPLIAAPRPLLVCFGDSITAGYGLTDGHAYSDFLQEKLDRAGYFYNVVNQGTSGATSKDADTTGDGSKNGLIEWSFGGNIYPGCGPTAGGGGNLNIVNHLTGAHFTGETFHVVDCRGPGTGSPKVTKNTIDWTGTGEVFGVAGLADGTPVTFVGTFQDLHESGAGFDGLYIAVTPVGSTTVIADFAIGTGPNALFLLSTGNVQIHQSSCGN